MNERLLDLLDHSIFEVIPMKSTAERALGLPTGATVSVTASPTKGMEATVELCAHLASHGYDVVAHLAARMIPSTGDLASIVDRLGSAGITRAFVVGGDATDHGEFPDAGALLSALATMSHPFAEIGIAGYPEGHPFIQPDALMTALSDKSPLAGHVTTQMCLDAGPIEQWIRDIRAAGIDLPVMVGVPGASDTLKLMAIGARIGVGASLRYLTKNRRVIARMIRPGLFTPDDLLDDIAGLDPTLGIRGLHIFTFNQVEDTVAWFEAALRDATHGPDSGQ